MDLRATHYGYAYQDLITGIALVDLMLGTAGKITVDTKGFPGDRFDDLTISYKTGRRVRIQIKHTSLDRKLSKDSFSGNRRSLRLDLLYGDLLCDLEQHPGTTYRVIVRDGDPDEDLAAVLKAINAAYDPGDPLPGVATRRFKFDPTALQEREPWKTRLTGLTEVQIRTACEYLTIDTSAPASTLDFSAPGPAERALLRRVVEELGAGRTPNTNIPPKYAALALTHAATGARARDGNVAQERVLPQVGLTTDFGAVAEGHPIETTVVVPRASAAAEVRMHVDTVVSAGGRVVVTGEPGVGKSWLCEQLADAYRDEDWIVARHHCWLGATDINREERVLTDVVIGSLLRQLEQVVPDATTNLRPRFAATPEALTAAVQACRDTHPERSVLLIVDGLDHVDRVLGRRTSQQMDPSRLLVEQLAAIDLPPGVCMLIASQPGAHLANAAPATSGPVQMPRMSWEEIRTLATTHELLTQPGGNEPLDDDDDDEHVIVDLIHDRSGGNALYATYLCRYATRTSPLDDDEAPGTVNDIIHRLTLVPDTATDVDAYYEYLLGAMTPDQLFAIGTLAVCDFALSANELGELLPQMLKPILGPALKTLAPVLNSQPGLGGLRIHHESFSRHILRDQDDEWVASIRESAAAWLAARGFFTDARAFRHLPELLAHLDQYDKLKELIQPGFVAEAIRAFQPPEALQRVVGIVARESEARLDWPTLITCVETRKSIDTYETESLTDSIVEYADVVVDVVGADVVAERLIYEGRPTFPSRWGLRLCESVDRAGAAAPWKAYIDARESESKRERSTYSSDDDGTLHLAIQLGALRLRNQRGDIPPNLAEQVAENLELNHKASLEDLVEVFTTGLPAGAMPDVAAAMTDPDKAARIYLKLADLAAAGTPGLPDPADLARQAWTLAPTLDIVGYLNHSIPAADVLAGLGTTDLEADVQAATDAVLGGRPADVQRWLSLLTLAHALDRTISLKYAGQLAGVGFYRAWLRYAAATIGSADDVASGVTTPEAASTAVLVALADLAAEAHPFTGDPRACDLYFIHSLIHKVIENSLVVVQPSDLDAVLARLVTISDDTTTTTNFGLPENGPLVTNELLEILSRVSDHIGVDAIHALMRVIRSRRRDTNTQYSVTANFELATARICVAASAKDEADECWRRACLLLASYGGHKDPTLSEIIESIYDIADVDIDTARTCLDRLVDLVYLVRQHTDGRDTSHYVDRWWEKAATIDPTAAGIGGADTLLTEVGFEDRRAYTAHTRLLETQVMTADPIVLAALRLTVGTDWRRPTTDLQLLTRLEDELDKSPQTNMMLAIVANNVAATYDDQPMLYSSDQPKSLVTPELIDAVVRLGGAAFPARTPRPEQERNSAWASTPKPDPLEIQKRLINDQRPVVPEGRTGAILAAREFEIQRYRDDAAPTWDLDAVTNAIGWRIIEATLTYGAETGIRLVDDVALEVARYSDNKLFADLGEGLAARCESTHDSLKTVASYCLTLAYIRIRGGGGWRTFAGRERVHLWTTAHALDSVTAETTLAAAIAETVDSDAQHTYGVTQAVVAAFASTPTCAPGGTAVQCWEAAFPIIQHRLPGIAERGGHTYRPTETPDSQDALDIALATLALATIAQPLRADLRQTLVATTLLVMCRPRIGQAALVHVLRTRLDAGRTTWLLDVIRACLPIGEMTDEMAAELTRLAGTDWLSVRVLADQILDAHERPAPHPPATEPAPKVRAAFHALMKKRE
ncbi:AAA family ATPase [Actinoallomurus acaciae]|uniref:AAA family ATPase n=1 Tax=Actinoallomurus acaciae TaxID=502577 RepID=A0ABV5Y7Y9_9ACTN